MNPHWLCRSKATFVSYDYSCYSLNFFFTCLQAVIVLSCALAFLLNYSVFLNTTINSALTQTVCGNLKVCNMFLQSVMHIPHEHQWCSSWIHIRNWDENNANENVNRGGAKNFSLLVLNHNPILFTRTFLVDCLNISNEFLHINTKFSNMYVCAVPLTLLTWDALCTRLFCNK